MTNTSGREHASLHSWWSLWSRDEGNGSGGGLSFAKSSPAPLPFVAFSLFLSLSSAKIQYGTWTGISLESTRTTSYAGEEHANFQCKSE